MTITSSEEKFRDPGYLWGQLMATQGLLLRLAGLTATKEDLREHGIESIEILRNTALPKPVPDSVLSGLDDFEKWLMHVTG